MTNELEKQFFDTFEIEPSTKYDYCWKSEENKDKLYPQITDRILLELICILTRWHLDEREPYEIISINMEQLKNQILSNSLYIAKFHKAKQQVQALFKECE